MFCIKMSKQDMDSSCYVSKCQFGTFLSVFWLYMMGKFYLEIILQNFIEYTFP